MMARKSPPPPAETPLDRVVRELAARHGVDVSVTAARGAGFTVSERVLQTMRTYGTMLFGMP
jgi:hypothetical protein